MKNDIVELKINRILLFSLVVLGCIIMTFIDGVISPNYMS